MKKTAPELLASAKILANEVVGCVASRLRSKGFQVEPSKTGWARSIKSKVDYGGVNVATMIVMWSVDGALLVMVAGQKRFAQNFSLRNTVSPRKISCLLVQWLKQAQVRSVMCE